MNTEPKLEAALVWDSAGHLAETAIAALVDGELGILPDDAARHAGECAACAERIAKAALLSLDIDAALQARRELAPAIAPARANLLPARRPLPWAAIAAAIAIAVVGQLPALRELPALLIRLPAVMLHALPVYARGVAVAIGQAHASGLVQRAWLATVMLLVMAGFLIARLAPRPLAYKRAS